MPIPYGIKVQIRDRSGDKATTEFLVTNTHTLIQYNLAIESLVEALDSVIGGVIEKAVLNIPVDMSALINNTALGASDVGDLGQFAFRTGDNRPVKMNVPGLIETLVASDSDDINQAQADVAAFITAMEDGILVTGSILVAPSNIGESDITTISYARERFRNRGARN